MDPHPFYQTIIDAYAAAGRPFIHQVTPAEARANLRAVMAAARPAGLPEMARVVDDAIEGAGGAIPTRRYVPVGRGAGTIIYLHAGGWVIGDLDFADATCRRLAGASGCEIVSVDYRKAPENPYPAGLDDAYSVLEWAARERSGPLLLVGESAGGNLATACAIRARDCQGPHITAQFLAYPVTDYALDTQSHREIGPRNLLLSTADMAWFWNHYCAPGTDRANPLVSPLRLPDAAGLPPALIFVAELDPLRDEGLAYADKLAAAGVSVSTRRDAGMVHGYLGGAGAIPLAAEALAQAGTWLRRQADAAVA